MSTTTEVRHECTSCGDDLSLSGIDVNDPFRDSEGEPICFNCYRDEYMFECGKCQEDQAGDEAGAVGNVILVFEDDCGVDQIGVYEVLRKPLYMQATVGAGSLYPDCLTYLGPIPEGLESDGCPCSFVCTECSVKIKAALP
jgi:hypothetical protein